MAEITAALVKELREITQLPMMKCKAALVKAGGDIQAAIEELRTEGEKVSTKMAGRATGEGRVAFYSADGAGGMVEFLCESAPVANNEEFRALADDMAKAVATSDIADEAALLKADSSKAGKTIGEVLNDLTGRIREAFKIGRIKKFTNNCAGYIHHDGSKAAAIEMEGSNEEVARQICMHIVAMTPAALSKDELDQEEVAKERAILTEQAKNEGKPEQFIEKMVEGRMRNYYAQHCLEDQPFVHDDKKTVSQAAKEGGIKVLSFTYWRLGEGQPVVEESAE